MPNKFLGELFMHSLTRVYYKQAGQAQFPPSRLERIDSFAHTWAGTFFVELEEFPSSSDFLSQHRINAILEKLQSQQLFSSDTHILLIHADCEHFDGPPKKDLVDHYYQQADAPIVSVAEQTYFPHHLRHLAKVMGLGYMFAFDDSLHADEFHYSYPINGMLSVDLKSPQPYSHWDLQAVLRGEQEQLSLYAAQKTDATLFIDPQNNMRIAFPHDRLTHAFGERTFTGAAAILDNAPFGAMYTIPNGTGCAFTADTKDDTYLGAFINQEFNVFESPSTTFPSHPAQPGTTGFFYYHIELVTEGEYDFSIRFTDDQRTWEHTKTNTILTKSNQVIHGRQALDTYYTPTCEFALGQLKHFPKFKQFLLEQSLRGFSIGHVGSEVHHAA